MCSTSSPSPPPDALSVALAGHCYVNTATVEAEVKKRPSDIMLINTVQMQDNYIQKVTSLYELYHSSADQKNDLHP